MRISANSFRDHVTNKDGYCTTCEEFTREGDTEGDAEDYPCPTCGGDTCLGAELALLIGEIEIV